MKKMNEIQWLAYRLNVIDDIDLGCFLDHHWPGEWQKFGCDKDIAFEQLTEYMSLEEFTEALDESCCWDYRE